ncbi:MAG: hypothetical protein ACJ77K_00380 [Bacteroidia bacterium]|jgi:hypothetical protein
MNTEEEIALHTHEMKALDNEALTAIVRNSENETEERLQAAWLILDERGIKDQVLDQLVKSDEKKKLSLSDLTDPENEEEVSDDNFAEKIEFVVGSEIPVSQRDLLGVLKITSAREEAKPVEEIDPDEQAKAKKRQEQQLMMAAASFLFLIAITIWQNDSITKFAFQGGLLLHSIVRLFFAFSNHLSGRINRDQ